MDSQSMITTLLDTHSAGGLLPFQPAKYYLDAGCVSIHDRFGFTADFQFSFLAQSVYWPKFINEHGFVLASGEVMDVLEQFLRARGPVLEVGSGTGYLSHELSRRGIDVTAVDHVDHSVLSPAARDQAAGGAHTIYPFQRFYRQDILGDGPAQLPGRFGCVLMTWPPHGDAFARRVAEAMMPGQHLVYEGEHEGTCAEPSFFEMLEDSTRWRRLDAESRALNKHHVTFRGLHDHWKVYERIA